MKTSDVYVTLVLFAILVVMTAFMDDSNIKSKNKQTSASQEIKLSKN